MRKVTLKDIASEVGVTVPTVSAALNRTGRVSDEMRSRVKQVADRLGYHPNLAAKVLKSKYNDSIGLVINNVPQDIRGSGLFEPLIFDFIQACEAEDIRYQIEVCDMLHDPVRLPKLMTGGVVGGILYGGYISKQIKEWQTGPLALPMVTLAEASDYCVVNDFRFGINQAIQYLAATGHKHIHFIGGPSAYRVHANCKAEAMKAASEFFLDFDTDKDVSELPLSDNKEESINISLEFFRQLFKREQLPSALLCSSGAMSARAAVFAAMEMGLRVPDDISIICVAAPWEAKSSCPSLSSIERDSVKMITAGIDVLNKLIQGREINPVTIAIPTKLELRNSTARKS